MALSNQRKVSVAALGLAVVGFAVDRLVLSEPAAGPAASSADLLVAPAASGTTASAKAAPEVPREQARMAELAKTLRELGVDAPVLASLPESFDVAIPVAATPEAVAPPPVPVGEPPVVTAVLTGQQPRAIAGGKSIAVGGQVDGWKVLFVGQGRVVFERNGQRVERLVHRGPTIASLSGGEPDAVR